MCPFCGSKKNKTIITTEKWSVISCCTCTNAWTSPQPDTIEYNKKDFHSEERTLNLEDLPPQWRKAINMQIRLLTKNLKSGAKILEIGCGQGIFLNELKKLDFDVTGVEPSETAAQKARERGLNVLTGYFPHPALVAKKFDAIIMIQVLEHIPEPKKILGEIKKIASGGILMLVQTNYRGLIPKIYKKYWYAWVPENHYWHFTPKGLQLYLKKFRFQKIKTEYSSLVHKRKILPFLTNILPHPYYPLTRHQ